MKKYILFLLIFFISYQSYGQNKNYNDNDTIINYLSKILNTNVTFYTLDGYHTNIKDSLRYEISIIMSYDKKNRKYKTYCNESLDNLFEKNNVKFPFTIPYNIMGEKIKINCDKRSHFNKICNN
jgi:hypothetical protein